MARAMSIKTCVLDAKILQGFVDSALHMHLRHQNILNCVEIIPEKSVSTSDGKIHFPVIL